MLKASVGYCSSYGQAINTTPRKYVFDVTSVGQRSSPWTCNSVKVEIKFHLECKLHFPSAQLMLRQMHLRKVFESIETKYCVSWLSFGVWQVWIRAIRTGSNSLNSAVSINTIMYMSFIRRSQTSSPKSFQQNLPKWGLLLGDLESIA